ncbi:MAG: serine/threonine-protein kinase [Gemmataceae bacterium]
MPAPATVAELLDLVQKSGVAEENRLKPYLDKLQQQAALPPEPSKVAGILVRDGFLTYFQAEQLLQGKYKRFSLGKYKVLEKLGSGGMGTVFLCEHKLMKRRVAVKVLPTAKAQDEASLGRFYREAKAVAAVDHANIVRAYDIDQDENLHFLVMEYVDGTNLQDLVKKFGPLDPIRACHYMYGSSAGLQHAHEIGLVHRDIKPGNILLDRSGVVKILDMGLARFFHDSEDNLTKQYDENILGTADYLSPEQAEDSHTVDIRSDIYSLGATFYFLLTGSQPFPEGTIPQKLIWTRTRQPKPIREIRPEVPPEIEAIVVKMMAKKPEDRFQLPSDVMAALTPWASMPIAPPSDREMPQLSPAVSGGQSGGTRPGVGGSPRSMVAAIPLMNGLSGAPTLTGTGNTPTPARGTPGGAAVWESLSDATLGTTPSGNSDDVDTQAPIPKSTKYKPAPAVEMKKRSRTPLVIAASAVLLVGAAAGAYFAFFNKAPVVPAATDPGRSKRLIVSKSPGGNDPVFATLTDAVRKAQSGDTIVINEPVLTEPGLRFSRTMKDITIEAGPQGKTVIEFSSGGASGSVPIIEVMNGTENITFKNLEFDGKGVADFGFLVSGLAPGLVLENVTVRGVKSVPFRLSTAAGLPGRPITLEHVRAVLAPSNEAAVLFAVPANSTIELKHIIVRNSRFEGPARAGIKADGSLVDVEITGNRFFSLDAALVFTRVPESRPYKCTVGQNTIYDAKVGVQFPGNPGGKMEIAVSRNYFAKTPAIVDGPGVVGVNATENGQRESGAGNGPISAVALDAPQLLPPNPNDDATFLRFPGGTAPIVNGNRIGAP